MTTKLIVFSAVNGEVHIYMPVMQQEDGESETDYLARVAARTLQSDPKLAGCVREADVEVADLPPRRWRNAWRHAGGMLLVVLASARLIRRQELSARRGKLLAVLADKIEQAVDNGQSALAATLRAKRRAVREAELTAAVNAVNDLAVLDTFEPAEFQGVE